MGIDAISQKECVNSEKQVYAFLIYIKKFLLVTSRLQRSHICLHLYNKKEKKYWYLSKRILYHETIRKAIENMCMLTLRNIKSF